MTGVGCGSTSWESVVAGFGRLEAPCYDGQGRLWFTDMEADGAVHRLESDGSVVEVAVRSHVGGLVPHAAGGVVATGHSVAVLGDGPSRTVMALAGGWGFNDLTTDRAGNVFVGMHGERPTASLPMAKASLWRVGVDGSVSCCYGGINLTNGLGVSPDGTRLYHADTLGRVIWVSDLGADGMPEPPRVFHEVGIGMPDGMAVDETGSVWYAAVGAGRVVRVSPNGVEDLVVETPMAWVSALCFGGSDGRDLFVTTFGAPYDPANTGSVLCTRSPVAGAPITPARV
jgi:sugar lactone lactonase YvrE